MTIRDSIFESALEQTVTIHGAHYARGPREDSFASIQIKGGRIACIQAHSPSGHANPPASIEIDLSGFLVMPGLINAHDHLEFSLFPRLADPPYRNYIEWGDDIHNKFSDVFARCRAVPKDVRTWWGGIRNLLCGVTTVSQHGPLLPEIQRADFPIRVVQQYGWAHSPALGGDLRAARASTPKGRAFIVHACEGTDELAREELWALDRLGILDTDTVLVHGLAIDGEGVALMVKRRASLIVCPSSNYFLFKKLPDLALLGEIEHVALGSDSPLTAAGDLLDEIRFAIYLRRISPEQAYRMVTTIPAGILRLEDAEGTIKESGVGDLIAIRHTGGNPAARLRSLSMEDVELVMVGGRVQLASETILARLPLSVKQGLEPLLVGSLIRWLRAPVADLLRKTEEVLGKDEARLGNRSILIPAFIEAGNVC